MCDYFVYTTVVLFARCTSMWCILHCIQCNVNSCSKFLPRRVPWIIWYTVWVLLLLLLGEYRLLLGVGTPRLLTAFGSCWIWSAFVYFVSMLSFCNVSVQNDHKRCVRSFLLMQEGLSNCALLFTSDVIILNAGKIRWVFKAIPLQPRSWTVQETFISSGDRYFYVYVLYVLNICICSLLRLRVIAFGMLKFFLSL